MVICLEQGAELHMAQLMPLPLTVSYFCKILIGFTFLVSTHPGSPGQRAVKRVCVLFMLFVIILSCILFIVFSFLFCYCYFVIYCLVLYYNFILFIFSILLSCAVQ